MNYEKIKFCNPKFSENLANEAFKTLINYHTDKHRFEQLLIYLNKIL